MIPAMLQDAFTQIAANESIASLTEHYAALGQRYMAGRGNGADLITGAMDALAYALARMPATYMAIESALRYMLESIDELPDTVLDIGAGTGAASWAMDALMKISGFSCFERNAAMRSQGSALMQWGSDALQKADWVDFDITKADIPIQGDMVIMGYMLNELAAGQKEKALRRAWQATNRYFVIVEPGTPQGFENILLARNLLPEMGANIIAPCAHINPCTNEWCGFSCRVPRSRIHKQTKGGDAPYEDEKYMYIAFSRSPANRSANRVLRHPQRRKKHILIEVCTERGVELKTITAKDKELYATAKKAKAGDGITV